MDNYLNAKKKLLSSDFISRYVDLTLTRVKDQEKVELLIYLYPKHNNAEFFTAIRKVNTLLEELDKTAWSYIYEETWTAEINEESEFSINIKAEPMQGYLFESNDIRVQVEQWLRSTSLAESKKYLDTKLFCDVIDILINEKFQQQFLIDFLYEKSNDYQIPIGIGKLIMVQRWEEIPGIKGSLKYYLFSNFDEWLCFDNQK